MIHQALFLFTGNSENSNKEKKKNLSGKGQVRNKIKNKASHVFSCYHVFWWGWGWGIKPEWRDMVVRT